MSYYYAACNGFFVPFQQGPTSLKYTYSLILRRNIKKLLELLDSKSLWSRRRTPINCQISESIVLSDFIEYSIPGIVVVCSKIKLEFRRDLGGGKSTFEVVLL